MGEASNHSTRNLIQELEAGRLEIAVLGAGVLVLVLSLVICIWIEVKRHGDETMYVEARSSRTRWTSDRKEGISHTNSRRPVRSVMDSVRRKPPSFPRCVNLLAGYAQRKMSVLEVSVHAQDSLESKRGIAPGLYQRSRAVSVIAQTVQESQNRSWSHVHTAPDHPCAQPHGALFERPRGRSLRRAQSPLGRVTDRAYMSSEDL